MKILLTGNGGFIGSHLMDAFLGNGHDVVGVDNFSTNNSSPSYIRKHQDNNKFKHYTIDLKDKGALLNLVAVEKDIDIVCHQAAFGGIPKSFEEPASYYENNLLPLINLIKLLPNAKFIFASSSSAYGMKSPYALTKVACEDYLAMSEINYATLRYFNVFGPRQLPGPIIPLMIEAKSNDLVIPIFGNTSRDFTYIKNVVEANLKAVHRLQSEGRFTLDVGCGKTTSIRDLAKTIGCKTVQQDGRHGDVETSCAKVSNKSWSLRDGLKDMGVI